MASTNFVGFLHAIGKHWLALMSGGVVIVLLGVFERLSGKNVPLWMYGCIGVAFVVMAVYLVWRDAMKDNANLVQSLADEKTKPELHGTINQFYIDPKDGLVAVDLSLWNVKTTPTSVQQFTIKIFANEGEYEGIETPCGSYFFLPLGFSEAEAIPLSALELLHRPLPDGYRQGQIEKERWLCFVITDNLPGDLNVIKATLIAFDVFDIAHEITCEPVPRLYGRVVRVARQRG